MSNGDNNVSDTPTMTGREYMPGRTSRPVAVAIDPVALVVTECITVTSAMRKHARWAHSSVSAILGGGPTRQPPSDRSSTHSRTDSGGNLGFAEEDGTVSTRWGLRGKKGKSMQDNPLLSAFARLRSHLKGCKGLFMTTLIAALY